MTSTFEQGRTRLDTRRERRRRVAVLLLAVVGAASTAWLAAGVVTWLFTGDMAWPSLQFRRLVTGDRQGGLLGLPRVEPDADVTAPDTGARPDEQGAPNGMQFPVMLAWPAPAGWTALIGLPLWLVWMRFLVLPLWNRVHYPARSRGLATARETRLVLGARVARRAGRYTLPGTSRWKRTVMPARAFGYHLGRHDNRLHGRGRSPRHSAARGRGPKIWADWEQRIRIVARTGWGKTDRLLVPIIRALPGPALVASIEPGIFERTVLARQCRRPAVRWRWLSLLLRRYRPIVEYPVAVVDVSAPDRRYAAGYPQVYWSPIIGCADYHIAYRRAIALVSGIDTPQGGGSDNDRFFRDSACEVLAAWLHAADLATKDIDDLADWLRRPDDPTAIRILRDDLTAEPSAAVNVRRHLDPAAGRTTSGVLRYLTLALNSLTTADGRRLCGHRDIDPQFDMEQMISAGGTVYLLADSSRLHRVKPLLSLFAAEMFYAAEGVALRTRHRRLTQPFIGVIDELRYGITVPNLPYIASAQRKYGIGYVYGVQTASQEDAVYGPDAPALRAAAGVSITGGIDIDSARELSDRAGTTPVVTPTRGGRPDDGRGVRLSEQLQHQHTLTVADQQRLGDGQAVVTARGLPPFFAAIPSYRDNRVLNRTITREADIVARQVAVVRSRHNALDGPSRHATGTGAGFTRATGDRR
ncbi:type IV secretory system conjugative DNA transfer family protein [Actinophytocola glycyrrhizae]|uniref:Type IV secretory system conjugative DNA transfer family protein n=1 Tax=Actinophytocola glycyrrhizae TaxID=2044873 RepID=A0ABV9SH07_9PSEU